jgi:chemotaxis signal transduction protein
VQAILLPVGDDLYAVPMSWVREVVRAPLVSPLVTAPPTVLGLFNLRGEIVPLLDTAALLGLGEIASVAFCVVINCALGPAGLAATSFPERVALGPSSGPSDLPGTAGVHHPGRRIAVLLDPDTLLAPERLGRLESRGPRQPTVARR